MIIIIDGTGAFSESDYKVSMANSFCSTLAKTAGSKAKYFRGPSALGLEVSGIIDEAVDVARSTPDQEPLYLCGYSRGGHIAIRTAQIIKPRPVKAMFLFDAVKRSLSGSSDRISDNVARAYHALRDQSSTQKKVEETRKLLDIANQRYDETRGKIYSAFFGPDQRSVAPVLDKINAHAINRNANYDSRNEEGFSVSNFGNTGLEADAATNLVKMIFKGSHGALGGVPWPDELLKGDRVSSLKVQAWMWANFSMEGVIKSVAQTT